MFMRISNLSNIMLKYDIGETRHFQLFMSGYDYGVK